MKKNTHFLPKNHEKLAKQYLFAIDDLTYRIIRILDSGKNLDDLLSEVCEAISSAHTSGNCVSVCINFDEKTHKNQYFSGTSTEIKHKFELPKKQVSTIELFLSRENREHFASFEL